MISVTLEPVILRRKKEGAPGQDVLDLGPPSGAGPSREEQGFGFGLTQLPTVGFCRVCQRFLRILNHDGAKAGLMKMF